MYRIDNDLCFSKLIRFLTLTRVANSVQTPVTPQVRGQVRSMGWGGFTGPEVRVSAAARTIINARPVAFTGSTDGTVRAWDLMSMKPFCPEILLPLPVTKIAIGPSNELVVVAGWEIIVLEPYQP